MPPTLSTALLVCSTCLLIFLLARAQRAAVATGRALAERARTLNHAASQLFEQGNAAAALSTITKLESDATWRRYGEVVRIPAMTILLRVDEAADAAEVLLEGVPRELSKFGTVMPAWQLTLEIGCVNTVVNALVTAGRYEQALLCDSKLSPDLVRHENKGVADACALLQINLAEAEMNLGRAEQALARLDRCEAGATSPLTTNGLAMQRGWILGTLGHGQAAVDAMVGAVPTNLGYLFTSEYYLSHAFALLALDQIDVAERELDAAMGAAKRPSTVRNALFLKARVAERKGDDDRATALCAEAAGHPHRWQGGDGFLFWGDLLARKGELVEARRCWHLAAERDPQSGSAGIARARLADSTGPSS